MISLVILTLSILIEVVVSFGLSLNQLDFLVFLTCSFGTASTACVFYVCVPGSKGDTDSLVLYHLPHAETC